MQGKDHFEPMAWVCISDEFDIMNISKTIFQSLGGANQEFNYLNLLQVALKERISKKRFLFALDDVWSDIYTNWEILGGPFLAGAPGRKVIMTTWKLSLLTQLVLYPYFVNMHWENQKTTLIHIWYLTIWRRKCNGLSLALKALGRLLWKKIHEEDWKVVLNSEIWSLEKGDGVVVALRLSYHDLSPCLKQLFAYCSLFPRDFEFDKEKLILLWMYEGFFHQSNASQTMERLGHEYFDQLLSRLDIEKKKEFRTESLERYRNISFVREEYMPLKGAKSVRTFLALFVGVIKSWQTFYFSNKVLENLLQELSLLRVLSLSNISISEVPEYIGSLKHLWYLNLSRTNIEQLPENICKLYNLHALNEAKLI
uniref:NB-ARC domain-containing protein n=1 Tax=Lactuca sativa TaxID=4236 RepID=A0A9R1XSZ6_LACSA|nr:hypothetical protein LSAT_V11C300149940 [Lactuca sativa]